MSLSISPLALKRRQQRKDSEIRNLPLNQPLLPMSQALAKTVIAQDAPSRNDTDHLLPVIAFLKAQGYEPATGDAFYSTRDGLSIYGFTEPLDVDLLQQHFVFPPSIELSYGQVFDRRHFVRIGQDFGPQMVRKLSFEV